MYSAIHGGRHSTRRVCRGMSFMALKYAPHEIRGFFVNVSLLAFAIVDQRDWTLK